MSLFGTVLNAGLDFASAEYFRDKSSDEATTNREYSRDEAKAQREWQEKMRATQYQTTVADLRSAGLNPALAYERGGAGVPSGGMGSPSSAGSVNAPSPSESMMRAQLQAQSAAQIAVMNATEAKTKAEEEKVRAETAEVQARTPTHAVSMDRMRQEITESIERIQTYAASAAHSHASAAQAHQNVQNLQAMLPQIAATIKNLEALTQLKGAEWNLAVQRARVTVYEGDKLRQEIVANLPELKSQLMKLERYAQELKMPGREQESSVQDSFIGSLGAVVRILSPLNRLLP